MKNGLYSIHVSLAGRAFWQGQRRGHVPGWQDPRRRRLSVLHRQLHAKGNTFKGEVLIQRHTSSPDANPLFGGAEPVGVGVSGTYTDTAAVMNGTALVGKASQIFEATLRFLADAD